MCTECTSEFRQFANRARRFPFSRESRNPRVSFTRAHRARSRESADRGPGPGEGEEDGAGTTRGNLSLLGDLFSKDKTRRTNFSGVTYGPSRGKYAFPR